MNSNNINTKNSAELQSEVRSSLSDILHDVGQLKTRMSPGQLIDDAIFYPHKGDPALTFEHLKRNPIGSTFLAIGTMLLMEDESHRTYEYSMKRNASQAATLTRGKVSQVNADAREKIGDIKARVSTSIDTAKSKVDDVREGIHAKVDTARTKVTGVKDNLQSSIDSAKSKVSTLKSDVSGTIDSAKSKVADLKGKMSSDTSSSTEGSNFSDVVSDKVSALGDMSGEVTGRISDTVDSATQTVRGMDPLAYMAIGLGLGALSGAAIPVSDAEQRIVNEKLGSRLADFKRECQSALNESYDTMKSEFVSEAKSFDLNKLKGLVGLSDSKNA